MKSDYREHRRIEAQRSEGGDFAWECTVLSLVLSLTDGGKACMLRRANKPGTAPDPHTDLSGFGMI